MTNAEIESFLSAENTADNLGFMWTTFEGGSHMATWVFSHGFHAHAEWLLNQTKATEDQREKLDSNKPFEAADKQESRPLSAAGSVSFVTGKTGSGTLGYNTGWYDPNGNVTTGHEPGWTLFTDVNLGSYYGNAVLWALDKDITKGVGGGAFAPNSDVTRAQVVTLLWRAAGKPEPTIGNPFTDVDPVKYGDYYKAILWAYEKGITKGSNSAGTTFSPDAVCTRSQLMTILWRYEEMPKSSAANPFTDVAIGAYYTDAVLWAYEKGITRGTNSAGTMFSPDATCTRGQCVTLLYRWFGD